MRGIVGTITHPDPLLARRMLGMLRHRGHVAAGIWHDADVALGQCGRRPERSAVPYVDGRGPYVLVADAALDYQDELRATLGLTAAEAPHDAALIVEAYLRWGNAFAEHLHGDFALALWDAPAGRLVCARDHFGLRPFYYARHGEGLAFASEMRALLLLPDVARTLDHEAAADFLLQATDDVTATFYRSIRRLPPAHVLVATHGDVRLHRYWALDPHRELRLRSDAAYAEAYRERFVAAVEACLHGGGRLGTLLSGGLDSSAVTVVARDQMRRTSGAALDTFSCVFDALPRCDERPFIGAVTATGGLQPHLIPADRTSIFDGLDRMLHHSEQPFFTPNLFLIWQAWAAAEEAGVERILHGFLGDNVVSSGARRLTELAVSLRWPKLLLELDRIAQLHGRSVGLYRRLLRHYVVTPLLPTALRRPNGAMAGRLAERLPFHRFVNPDFARAVDWSARARRQAAAALAAPHSGRTEHHAELTGGLIPGALEIENKTAAAFGIEQRYPFADRRLVEFCLAVPTDQKYRAGRTRHIAREALRGVLPEAVRMRATKANLHPSFEHALLRLGRAELDELMTDRLAIAADMLDVAALRTAYREVRRCYDATGRPGTSIVPFWLAAQLVRWLERERGAVLFPPPVHNELLLDVQ